MYIEPNSTIEVYQGVDLEPDYVNTYYFEYVSERDSFFDTHFKVATFERQSYQRKERGYIKIDAPISTLAHCNYLRFKNTNFEDFWFYGFILSVEYINNNNTLIKYEIDVMTTWMGQYTLRESFVEREHQRTDVVGDNLLAENVNIGDYIDSESGFTGFFNDYSLIVAATFDKNLNDVRAVYYSYKNYSGLMLNDFDLTPSGMQQATAFLNSAYSAGKNDQIVALFYFPKEFVVPITGSIPPPITKEVTRYKRTSGAIDGYTPRNNKLYTYPYNFLHVWSGSGDEKDMPFEYFSTSECKFNLKCSFSSKPEAVLYPLNYNGIPENKEANLNLNNFPQVSFNSDTFKQWWAYTSQALPSQIATNVAGGALGGLLLGGNPITALVGAGVGLMKQIGSTITEYNKQKISTQQNKGISNSVTSVEGGFLDFFFTHRHIRRQYLEIIDNYFDVFGYACLRSKVPNRRNRQTWTYIKTIGCNINNMGIPCDDAEKIKQIYDKGITFWVSNSIIGDYSQNNAPLG